VEIVHVRGRNDKICAVTEVNLDFSDFRDEGKG